MASKYQKRHYEDVAEILRRRYYPLHRKKVVAWQSLADDFAILFAADNPLFDRERFLKACGLETA